MEKNMTEATRNIIDYAENDDAKAMRDTLYSDIHDRVMQHLDAKKQEIAKNIFTSSDETEETEEVDDGEEVENT